MHVVIIDPHVGGGHHLPYVRAVAGEALRRGWTVSLVLRRELAGTVEIEDLQEVCSRCRAVVFLGISSLNKWQTVWSYGRHQFERLKYVRDGMKIGDTELNADVAFIVDCDSWYPAAVLFGRKLARLQAVTVSFRTRWHYEACNITAHCSRFQRFVQECVFTQWLSLEWLRYLVVTDDECLGPHLRTRRIAGAHKVRYIPELADVPVLPDRGEARLRLGIDPNAKVILSFGAQTGRKALKQLVDALSAPHCDPQLTLLAVGVQDSATKILLADVPARSLARARRLLTIPRYVSQEEMANVFAASDAAWLAYRNHLGPSAFLWQAICAGLPVIAGTQGLIGYWVGRLSAGITVNSDDSEQILGAVRDIVGFKAQQGIHSEDLAQLSAAHTPAAFGAAVCELLKDSLAGLNDRGTTRVN